MTAVDVSFRFTWLTNPLTHQSVVGPNPVRGGEASLGGTIRPYAGGRLRVITTSSDVRTYTVVFQSLDDAGLLLMDGWRGQVLLLRDAMGWRKWVSMLDIQWADYPSAGGMGHDVTVPFQEVTYDESVA